MALSTLRDKYTAFDGGADPCSHRLFSHTSSTSNSFCHRKSFSSDTFTASSDRRTVNLHDICNEFRVVRDQKRRQSLMMPLSTACHSALASTTTTTLPGVLENNDNGRIAYSSHQGFSKTLRPHAQSNNTSSNGAGFALPRPPFALDSSTSSPSTTTSTLNSAVTENSPISSPQSPNSLLQAPFRSGQQTQNTNKDASMDLLGDEVSPVRPSTSASDSAALRKGRNLKNLLINTSGISAKQNIDSRTAAKDGLARRPATQSGPAPTFKSGSLPPVSGSAPVSPSFIIPKMPPRRKPSKLGLTIATPETDQKAAVPPTPSFNASFASTRPGIVPMQLQTIPQTPAFPPDHETDNRYDALADQSAVEVPPPPPPPMELLGGMSLPTVTGRELRTPGLAPMGGMTLPPFGSVESSPSKKSSPGSDRYRPLQDHMGLQRHQSAEQVGESSSIVNQTIEHVNSIPVHDLPLSQEVKSPSYPDGPACIYPPNVYLYHQPTANEARNFDVVINVAREVCNPFEIEAEEEKARLIAKDTEPVRPKKPTYRSVGVQVELLTEEYPPKVDTSAEPATAVSDSSLGSALERLGISTDDNLSPPTPKVSRPQPEYLHLPWEHNSQVYEDWYDICRLIDERTKQGKKVLIHCQLGVSRSASLIVAYGIYLNPGLSPHEAREQAKTRSRWIDLNMHFMYELGDFKKLLAQKGVTVPDVPKSRTSSGQGIKPFPLSLSRSKTDTVLLSPVQSVPSTPLSTLSSIPGSASFTGADGTAGQFVGLPDGLRTPGASSVPSDTVAFISKKSAGGANSSLSAVSDSPANPTSSDFVNGIKLPAPVDSSVGQPSTSLKTPALDMPGGWAATPAMSRPTSMVLPEVPSQPPNTLSSDSTDKTPAQSPLPSPDAAAETSSLSAESKPVRAPSFRRLPKMPSLPSGFTTSIGSFFSLNRSASTASKKSASSSSRPGSIIASRPQTRLDTIPGTPVDGPDSDASAVSNLRKPPSLPSLRTFFPIGTASEGRSNKPGLSLTLDTIPQSAVGGDDDVGQDASFADLMSPRAQEFVPNPFNRPVTSHAALNGQPEQRQLGGFSGLMGSFAQLGIRKRASGQSLRDPNKDETTSHQKDADAGNVNGIASGLGRKASTSSHKTVVHVERNDSTLENGALGELASPGTQAKDPRSPPSMGTWGAEERIMRNIDDVL